MGYKEEKLFTPEFGITIDVSLDSNCGVFRRYHVTNNPIFNPTYRRIVPLKGALKGKYRYGKSKTRIIYEPDNATKTVYPLDIDKITDISYKKKSKRK